MTPMIYVGLTKSLRIQSLNKYRNPIDIINMVCDALKVKKADLLSPKRHREIAEARCISIGLILKSNPAITLKQVGALFSGRDHSTIIYNRDLFDALCSSDKGFTEKVRIVIGDTF